MKNLFFLFIISSVLFACGSDDTPEAEPVFDYPVTLRATGYEIKSKIRMYTPNGEVKNQAFINDYVNRPPVPETMPADNTLFYIDTNTLVDVSKFGLLNYTHKDTILFDDPEPWNKRIVKKENGYNYFYMRDTLTTLSQQGSNEHLNTIMDNIGTYKPYRKPFMLGGEPLYWRYYDARIAKGNPNKLEFPNLIYKISTKNNSGYSYTSTKHYNNIFDPSVLNLLQPGDTLLVQEVNIIYTKQ